MKQNYIFLDIDGPLLPGRSVVFPNFLQFQRAFVDGQDITEILQSIPLTFDPWSVRVHNLLAELSDAKIVLATAWRQWCSTEQLQSLFLSQGLKFNYADPPGCITRGFSNNRLHDIAEHMREMIPEDSRVLIIDDADLASLNQFFPLESSETAYTNTVYGYPDHNDDQVGVIPDKRIRWKWLNVDYMNGLTYQQYKIGLEFLTG
jgi:hypothetical protein